MNPNSHVWWIQAFPSFPLLHQTWATWDAAQIDGSRSMSHAHQKAVDYSKGHQQNKCSNNSGVSQKERPKCGSRFSLLPGWLEQYYLSRIADLCAIEDLRAARARCSHALAFQNGPVAGAQMGVY